MLQYLVILLDDTSTSYCHYTNCKQERHLISLDDLKSGILFGMKENLMIQFVYPDYEIPQSYKDVIETIDHSKIMPKTGENADITVFNGWCEMVNFPFDVKNVYVLRINKSDLFAQRGFIKTILGKVARLNVVVTDVENFIDADWDAYKDCLEEWSDELKRLYAVGTSPQFNLITDRVFLDKMNNCDAGDTSITLAPDGYLYICPAFYLDGSPDGREKSLAEVSSKGYRIGSLTEGLNIKNPQLYKLSHAPLCRICDSFHCKRCVWLNRRITSEVNTPSRQQCIMSHIERNASRKLLDILRNDIPSLYGKEIKELSYLDPFEIVNK
ncbi:MAG: CXXX repeat peptide maturase [Prevotellaceae bacterium]|nr:CXXX repeat peptide maturase [Candidatus Faecinaster equi]